MQWRKKLLPVILIVLIIAVNAVTVTLLIRRARLPQATVAFDPPDRITVALDGERRSFSPATPEYKKLYERSERRCRMLSSLGLYRSMGIETQGVLTVCYEYDTPRELKFTVDGKKVGFPVRQVLFALTGEDYKMVQLSGEYNSVCGDLPADRELIEFATQILKK